jgi:Flp pilus assembly protein TadG
MKRFSKAESGTSMAEFAIVAGVFMMIIFGIIEFGRLMYTHNALTDAARRGARYAVLHPENSNTCVQRVMIYGEWNVGPTPTCTLTGTPPQMINNLASATITVVYEGEDLDGDPDSPNPYGMNLGTATVTITNYQFNLSIPFFRQTLTMPSYTTTLTAESSGIEPAPIP